jgi:hypothetical protein
MLRPAYLRPRNSARLFSTEPLRPYTLLAPAGRGSGCGIGEFLVDALCAAARRYEPGRSSQLHAVIVYFHGFDAAPGGCQQTPLLFAGIEREKVRNAVDFKIHNSPLRARPSCHLRSIRPLAKRLELAASSREYVPAARSPGCRLLFILHVNVLGVDNAFVLLGFRLGLRLSLLRTRFRSGGGRFVHCLRQFVRCRL